MGQLEQMRAYQNNEGARHALAARRADEMFEKHPQLAVPPPYLNSVAAAVEPKRRAGGEAGLRRVVGAGKHKAKKAPEAEKEMEEESEGEEMEGGGIISGLNIPIISGLAGLFGLGKGEADPKKALLYGKKAAQHLKKMHGAGFLDDFAKGFMSVIKPVASIVGTVAPLIPHPAARAAGAAANVISGLTGGGRLVPNAIPSGQQGIPPQAPEWFQRNMVGQGRRKKGGRTMMSPDAIIAYQNARKKKMEAEAPPNLSTPEPVLMPLKALGRGRAGAGRAGAGSTGAGGAGAGMAGAGSAGAGKRAARNALVKKVMAEEGLSMPAASKYIKEHGLA